MTRLEFQQVIGDLLRTAREDAGLSQRALAERLGVTPTAVSYWENGIHGMSFWMVTRLDLMFAGWRS